MIQLPLLSFEKEILKHTLCTYMNTVTQILCQWAFLVIYILLHYTQLQTLLHRFDDSFGAKWGFTLL